MNNSPERKANAYELEQLENAATAEGRRSRSGGLEYTAEEEAKIIRKLDYRLLPFLLLLYTFSVLDRSNLGNAKLAGMTKDIDLGGLRYNWLGTIFYIAYIVSQPTTLGWKHFRPHIWCATAVFFWGTIASVQAAVQSWGGLMTCRFLLGVAEAMFGPGVPLYLSYFYPRARIGFRHGVFISGSALANAYGSTLAYGITQIKGSIGPWRILFLIEGLPTLLLAVWTFFYLPDSISAAKFLSEREKEIAKSMVGRNQVLGNGAGVNLREVFAAYLDPKSYLPAIMYFSVNVSFASLPLFAPTIISELGIFTTVQSQGLTAPPYVLVFCTILITAWATDKAKIRGPFVTLYSLIAAIGFILLGTTKSPAARYIGIFLSVQIFTCVSLLLTWTANLHATESKRAGSYTILGLIGQAGPILGTNLFPAKDKPYYRKGAWVSCGMCLVVTVTSLVLTLYLMRENRRLEKAGLLVHDDEEIIDAPGTEAGREKQYKYVY